MQDQQRRLLARVHGRERRTDGRREPAEHVGALPHGGRAQEDLGAGLQGRTTGRTFARASRTCRSSCSVRVRTRGRSSTSPRRSTAARVRAARTTRHPRTTTCSSRASPASAAGWAYFGFSYYIENQSRLNAVQVTNPKTNTCVAPSKATRLQQHLQAALATALHLREGLVVQAAGSAGVHRLHLRQRGRDREPVRLHLADAEAAEAGEDELHPRREGGEPQLASPSDDTCPPRSGLRAASWFRGSTHRQLIDTMFVVKELPLVECCTPIAGPTLSAERGGRARAAVQGARRPASAADPQLPAAGRRANRCACASSSRSSASGSRP